MLKLINLEKGKLCLYELEILKNCDNILNKMFSKTHKVDSIYKKDSWIFHDHLDEEYRFKYLLRDDKNLQKEVITPYIYKCIRTNETKQDNSYAAYQITNPISIELGFQKLKDLGDRKQAINSLKLLCNYLNNREQKDLDLFNEYKDDILSTFTISEYSTDLLAKNGIGIVNNYNIDFVRKKDIIPPINAIDFTNLKEEKVYKKL